MSFQFQNNFVMGRLSKLMLNLSSSIFSPAHPTRSVKSKSVMHSMHSILSINASVIQVVRKSGAQPRPAVVRASTHIAQSAQNYNERILIVVSNLKVERFKKIAWIQSHHLHLQ